MINYNKQVYIVENAETGAIKIGVSGDYKRRIKELKFLFVFKSGRSFATDRISDCFFLERKIHGKLSKYALGMEWFKYNFLWGKKIVEKMCKEHCPISIKSKYFKERKKRKLTQMDVAIQADISLVTYQLIERGITKNPAEKTVKKIEELLTKEV